MELHSACYRFGFDHSPDDFRGNFHPSSLSISFPFIVECYATIGIRLLLTSVLCDGMFRLFQFEVR